MSVQELDYSTHGAGGSIANIRPMIFLNHDKSFNHSHHGRIPIVLTKDKMCIGCTDITVEAAKLLLQKWNEKFGAIPTAVTIQ